MDHDFRSLRRTLTGLVIATVLIFAVLLGTLGALVRDQLRTEIRQREAEAIHAVAMMQMRSAQARFERLGLELTSNDVFTAVLESSRLKGVLAVQLFDAAGTLRDGLPALPAEAAVQQAWWQKPLPHAEARFHESRALEEVFGETESAGGTRVPLLEVVVPLGGEANQPAFGVARYWIEGSAMQGEYARLDRRLVAQAGATLAGGILLIGLLASWAYRRLAAAQTELVERTQALARANEELDFAAKTGALGAISAHLIHGLRNPLAGLEGFVSEVAASDGGRVAAPHRAEAMETARRLRTLVNEVVSVLRDEHSADRAECLPIAELVESMRTRALASAEERGVALECRVDGPGTLSVRSGNLAALVIANLLGNALEASQPGATVWLEAWSDGQNVNFTVADAGNGLPPRVRESLFRPVVSSKAGGGGLGLAISHRLARHAGGELTLLRSDGSGTVFRLQVPAA